MSIQLLINKIDGVRLRQQMSEKNLADGATSWKFTQDVEQNVDMRHRDGNGAPVKLPNYTVYLAAGLKNLVIEKKGDVTHVPFRNSSLRNQIRVKTQNYADAGRRDKKGNVVKEWQDVGTPAYIAASQWGGALVGDEVRVIVDEMPT